MNRQIVFVLSTNYAGSHFLSLQLGSHSRCASIGELRRFEWARIQICHRCESDEVCPLFGGLSDTRLNDLYEKLFANLSEYDPNVKTVIDNSKKTTWAKRFVDLQGFGKKYIHLIRDPRALIRNWMLNYETEEAKNKVRKRMAGRCWRHFWSIFRSNEADVYLWKWLYQNKLITDFIRQYALDAHVITYHDLVFHPDHILTQLMNWIGLDYEPEQTVYWRFVHHGTVKKQYLESLEDRGRIFDQRWREFLDSETQRSALTHPAIQDYLSNIGLKFDKQKGLIGPFGLSKAS